MIAEEQQHQINNLIQSGKRQYGRSLNIALSQQRSQGVFKHTVISIAEQLFQDISVLFSSLDREVIAAITASDFNPLIDEIIEHALHSHRTSCALSNFEAEHKPDRTYIAEVLSEVDRKRNLFMQQIAV